MDESADALTMTTTHTIVLDKYLILIHNTDFRSPPVYGHQPKPIKNFDLMRYMSSEHEYENSEVVNPYTIRGLLMVNSKHRLPTNVEDIRSYVSEEVDHHCGAFEVNEGDRIHWRAVSLTEWFNELSDPEKGLVYNNNAEYARFNVTPPRTIYGSYVFGSNDEG